MNAGGMMLQPSLQSNEIKMQAAEHTSAAPNMSPFQNLLNKAQADSRIDVQQLLASNDKDQGQKASEGKDMLQLLKQLIASLFRENEGSEQDMAALEDMIKNQTDKGSDNKQLKAMLEDLQESLTELNDKDADADQTGNALLQLMAKLVKQDAGETSEKDTLPEDMIKNQTDKGSDNEQLKAMLEDLQESLTELNDKDADADQAGNVLLQFMAKLVKQDAGETSEDLKKTLDNPIIAPEKLQAMIDQLLTHLNEKTAQTDKSEQQKVPVLMRMPAISKPDSDGQTAQQQFKLLFAAAENQLNQINNQGDLSKAAPELLQLLKKWTALVKKTNQQPGNVLESGSGHDDKNQKIWKDLVQFFQKRHQFTMKQQYHTNAKVTSRDVAKWLQHAMQTQNEPAGKQAAPGVTMSSPLPMSKAEQFVIHLNQTQNSQANGQQLMEQFQKVLKTSTFLQKSNGASQLNISLKPENLGDMQVKLTQMNGEMTVKIMVSTAAAKDMLETNMHQLKNMFSPQQVMIEKQDPAVQEAPSNQQEEHDQPMDSDEQDQSGQSEQKEDQEDEDDGFDDELEAIMTSTEVTYDIH